MQHEPRLSAYHVLARVAEAHAAEEGNSRLIEEETTDEILRLIAEDTYDGEIPDPQQLLRAYIETQVKRIPRQEASRFKQQVRKMPLSGALDLGTQWERTILVCGKEALTALTGVEQMHGRIVTLGGLRDTDVRLMRVEQQLNLEKQAQAVQEMGDRYRLLEASLARHVNYHAYRTAVA
jgi:hypothetical protein